MISTDRLLTVVLVYAFLIFVCLGGIYVSNFGTVPLFVLAIACFATVIAASLLISWGAECYQFVVSQGFAVAVIALLQVFPEFLVEAVIAWDKDIPLMMANFTGSNRLLMGLGWSGVFFIASTVNFFKKGKFLWSVKIREEHSLEIMALLVSSIYFCVILMKGYLSILDSLVLFFIFSIYMWALYNLEPEDSEKEEDLLDTCKAITMVGNPLLKRTIIFLLFAVGGITFLLVAEPFIESLKHMSAAFGISTFIFVQWIAPFLTEFPEKATAFYWASQVKLAPMGLINFISSKVNQWTLLIAMVPIVYSISMGAVSSIPLDDFHKLQIFLSMVMTFYGCTCLAKFKFNMIDAFVMFTIWLVQFLIPSTLILTTWAFIIMSMVNLVMYRRSNKLMQSFVRTVESIYRKKRLRPVSL